MSQFDKIIGYESIKNELKQICDCIKNKEKYEKMGAKIPKGLLIHGEPGLGKTLMARCLIDECNINCYTVSKTKETKDCVKDIEKSFKEAKQNAPSIVFLDDMDKFANTGVTNKDAVEYVSIQSWIDKVRDKDVFVIATTNDLRKLPDSLIRVGRFDRKIYVKEPSLEDAKKIIEHYLIGKNVAGNVDIEDLTKMISTYTSVELETVLNEAALRACYNEKKIIEMDDFVNVLLKMDHSIVLGSDCEDESKKRRIALHEAGHVVMSEIFNPNNVGFVVINGNGVKGGSVGGYMKQSESINDSEINVMIYLAGNIAVQMYYPGEKSSGCGSDFRNAQKALEKDFVNDGKYGVLKVRDDGDIGSFETTEVYRQEIRNYVNSEMERYENRVRKLLWRNREFVEKVADGLMERQYLLFSEVKKIRESVEVVGE